jgi:putative transposase
VGAGSITGPKTHISRFAEEKGAMAKFRDVKTLQKFAAVHASLHNHFNENRHLDRRDILKENRSAAVAESRELAA